MGARKIEEIDHKKVTDRILDSFRKLDKQQKVKVIRRVSRGMGLREAMRIVGAGDK